MCALYSSVKSRSSRCLSATSSTRNGAYSRSHAAWVRRRGGRADRTLSSHCSGEDSPSRTRRRPVVTGASIPWRSKARPSSGTVASDSAVWALDAWTFPAGTPAPTLSPARRFGGPRFLAAGGDARAGGVAGAPAGGAARLEHVVQLAGKVGVAGGEHHGGPE